MELRRYALLFWRWLWLIILGMGLAAASAYVTSKNTTPVYSASTKLLISPSKVQVMDTLSFQPGIDRLGATYADIMGGRPVLAEVTRNLSLPEKATWSVSVSLIRNTQLLQLVVEDTDRERAAIIANEIPRVFVRQNSELQARRYADSKASLQHQIDKTQARISEVQDQVQALATATSPDQNELDRQRRELQTLQSSYYTLTADYEGLRLEEAKQLDTLLVTEEATPPVRPVRPKTAQNIRLAALLGAMLAAGIAYLVEYLDDALKSPDEVQKVLGLCPLSVTPEAESRSDVPELAMLANTRNPGAEAYRVLRTNLQFAGVGKPIRTLLVTSPSPSEGKTTTAANLAIALAQAGKRVVLVDADLHRPRLHRILKLHNNVGLTSALVEANGQYGALLQATNVPGLRVLASGPLPPNPAELLGTAEMREILTSLAGDADLVILDSPPTLALADATVLATQVDGVLLVLDAKRTRRDMANRAVAGLQQVQARMVGVVLNRLATRGRGSYYYYNYSHNYPSDERDSQKGKGIGGLASRILGRLSVCFQAVFALIYRYSRGQGDQEAHRAR